MTVMGLQLILCLTVVTGPARQESLHFLTLWQRTYFTAGARVGKKLRSMLCMC